MLVMRIIFIVFTLAIITSNTANAQKHAGPIKWFSLQEADSLYQTNPKPLFIDVYTDWCGWCKRMDATTFQDKSIANYLNSNFYPVKLDAETNDSIRFQGKMYYNTQKETISRIMDSLTLDLNDAVKKIKKMDLILASEITLKLKEVKTNDFLISEIDSALKIKDVKRLKSFLVSTSKKANTSDKTDKTIEKTKRLKKSNKSELEKFKSDLEKSNNLLNTSTGKNKKNVEVQKNNININGKKSQLNNIARRARKTTHDVAIYLCNGQLSYPTFNLLFGDSLRGNMPLKGFQKVPDLFGYLAFISEGIYKNSRDVASFVNTFKEVYTPGYEEPKDLIKWKGFEQALDIAKKDGKKILVHLIHPTSIASNLMDKESFRDPITANKINSNLHAVKLAINSEEIVTYFDKEYKNVNGIHDLAYMLSQNQLIFPQFVFLDENGRLIMKVPQYFGKTEIDPVLDYFIEEGYLNAVYGDWLKTKKQ
jgi:thioredoxin-related protein